MLSFCLDESCWENEKRMVVLPKLEGGDDRRGEGT